MSIVYVNGSTVIMMRQWHFAFLSYLAWIQHSFSCYALLISRVGLTAEVDCECDYWLPLSAQC